MMKNESMIRILTHRKRISVAKIHRFLDFNVVLISRHA